MAGDKRGIIDLVLGFWIISLCSAFLVQTGFSKGKASALEIPRPTPIPTPLPTVRPRPIPPSPIPSPHRVHPMWVGQGDVVSRDDEFVCRVLCKEEWFGKSFEILQATRGGEDWVSLEGQKAVCTPESDDQGIRALVAGRWATPADSPEQALCFLVISEIRHSQ